VNWLRFHRIEYFDHTGFILFAGLLIHGDVAIIAYASDHGK
jgi:hypothetical protein